MEIYKQKVAPILDSVSVKLGLQNLDKNELFTKYTDKVGVKPSHIAIVLGGLLLVLSLLNVGSSLICNIIGFIYPAYMSFKALETQQSNDDKQWLTYWVVYSLFTVLDSFIGFTLSFIPFYYFLKLSFYVYLFHPKTLGATVIYEKVIQPLFKKYESDIDSNINRIGKSVQ